MRENPIKSIVLIILVLIISGGVVYFLNRGFIETANKEVKSISPENYSENSKNDVQIGDIIEITGTPNLLQQVSQEPTNDNDEEARRNTFYYVGLKEYGFDFVVRVKVGKVNSEQQTFIGQVTGLSNTEFGTRIKNSLNKPINFDESINREIAGELDEESKKQIEDKSIAKFTDSTLLVLDGEVVDLNGIYANIVFHTLILSVFVITLFRKKIFPGLN